MYFSKMESPQNIIFLYSKYSTGCTKLLADISKYSLKFITPLCIDNKLIRNRIKKSMYQIKQVPCVLITYPQGNIEKFEGEQSIKWFDEIVKNVQKQEEEEKNKQQEAKRLEQLELENENLRLKQQLASQESMKKSADDYVPQSVANQSKDDFTSIGDLLGETDEGGITSAKSAKITDKGSANLLDLDDLDINRYEESAKKKVSTNSILSKAAELQKARDIEDTRKKPI